MKEFFTIKNSQLLRLLMVLFLITLPQIIYAQGGTGMIDYTTSQVVGQDYGRDYLDRFCRDTQNTGRDGCSRQTITSFNNWLNEKYPTSAGISNFYRQRDAIRDYVGWANYDEQIQNLRDQQIGLDLSTSEDAVENEYLQNQIRFLENERQIATNHQTTLTSSISDHETEIRNKDNMLRCSGILSWTIQDCLLYGTAYLMRIVLSVFAWILYLANELFNAILKLSVIDFHEYLKTSGGNSDKLYFPLGTAINIGWTIIRDLFNIAFIFILLYVAIGTILRRSEVNAKKMITNIIIAALLINFSAIFPKIIIDATNVISVTFYRGMTPINGQTNNTSITKAPDLVRALIDKMPLGLNDYNGDTNNQFGLNENTSRYEAYRIIFDSFVQIILVLVAAFVLLTVAFMLIVRIITLLMLIMTSPIAFGSMILPDFLKKETGGWWNKLISETVWLPVFMIMFYITIQIAQAITISNTGAPRVDADGTGSVSFDFFRLLIAYIILIGFMVYSLVIAKKIGGIGATGAMALAGGITALGAGAAWGTIRKTGGYGGRAIGAVASKTDKTFLGGAGGRLVDTTYKKIKPVGDYLAKTDLGKKVISTTKPIKENILHPLRYASDTVATTSGLGIGFLGKAGKERAEDAKKLKDVEKEEEDKKKKDKKDKIDKAGKTIENATKSVNDLFDEAGNIKDEHAKDSSGNVVKVNGKNVANKATQDKIDATEKAVNETLAGFNNNDLKDFKIDTLINPVVAKSLNYSEINAIRDKLNHSQLEQMRNYIQNQNNALYQEIGAGNTRASWGIPKPTSTTQTTETNPTGNTNQIGNTNTTPIRDGSDRAGGSNQTSGQTPPITPAQVQQALSELRSIAQATTADRQTLVGAINDHLPNLVSGNKSEAVNLFTQNAQMLTKIDQAGLSIDDFKNIGRKMNGDVILRIKQELQRAAINQTAPLRANVNGQFDQFINNPAYVDQTTGLIM
ncbi:MAG: hypothetical protein HYV76_02975 [Candidatus Vogelbacteria bacterium]|nr:hypothetical protein [Candidatus Vogelbacteria bacterium]